jgi:hypothetical protein
MNCAYCEDRMSDYIENTLSVEERAVLDLHFQSCGSCSELRSGVVEVLQWGKSFPIQEPAVWLPARIVANTPTVVRLTWKDLWSAAWQTVSEPRFALALFTATLVLGWLGNVTGISPSVATLVRHPTAIYYGIEGLANRAYGDLVRNYYGSPLVREIQCQIHTRIEQFRENS